MTDPQRLGVAWCGPVFEATGYADELRGMVSAMDEAGLDVTLYNVRPELPGFRESLDSKVRTALERCLSRPLSPAFVQVQHGAMDGFGPFHTDAAFRVGRSMLETSNLPSHWVRAANHLDELWIPSTFNYDVFRRAGVRVPMHIVPGGIDSAEYNPDVPPRPFPDRRATVFLSIFEWRLRKGWDILLRAWADAFTAQDDVCLVLRTYPIKKDASKSSTDTINGYIDEFLNTQCGGRRRADVAPIHVMGHGIPGRDMPALHTMADVFVLPTRGEGWGRPYMEAMASGVPVIATDWSAHRAFVTAENSYLLPVSDLVPADWEEVGIYAGMHWAEPSTDALTGLLRRAHTNPTERRALGARARVDMVTKWPWSRVADAIVARVAVLSGAAAGGTTRATPLVTPDPMLVIETPGFNARMPDHDVLAMLESCSDHGVEMRWRTESPGIRPSRSDSMYPLWVSASAQMAADATQFTVLGSVENAPSLCRPRSGRWIVATGAQVDTTVPDGWATMLRDEARWVLVPHDDAAAACRSIGVPAERLRVVPPPVDLTRFSTEGANYRWALPWGPRFLLFATGLSDAVLANAIAAFEAAFAPGDQAVLHIVLPTPEAPKGSHLPFIEAVRHRGATNRLVWLDTQPIARDETAALYRSADVLWLMPGQLGTGRVIHEALACGTPIFAPHTPRSASVVDATCGWLYAPASTSADVTAERIRAIGLKVTDVAAREQLRRHARSRAESLVGRGESLVMALHALIDGAGPVPAPREG